MISVLVADDSALVRRLLSRVLTDEPDITVVGTAHHGATMLDKVEQLQPDLVTLDIEMPVMDGLTAMRELHRRHPRLPVIMVSTLTERGAAVTLDALAAGARDYVTKPTNSISLASSLDDLRDQLIPRIRALTGARPPADRRTGPTTTRAPLVAARRQRRQRSARPVEIIAVGSSTGGPDALSRMLGGLTRSLPVPVVAVQHMPPLFTTMLAQRLDRTSRLAVVEASDGQPLEPGTFYLAPGGRHLEVVRKGPTVVTRLHDGEPVNYSRPSVDVLFRSVAAAYPGSAVGVVLTGMGHDGREGCRSMAETGSLIVAQDQASSVVWGMPGAVTEAELVDSVLDLNGIAPFLLDQTGPAGPKRRIAGVA